MPGTEDTEEEIHTKPCSFPNWGARARGLSRTRRLEFLGQSTRQERAAQEDVLLKYSGEYQSLYVCEETIWARSTRKDHREQSLDFTQGHE